MTVLVWFLYRRWRLIGWIKEYDAGNREILLSNAYKVNLCSCREHKVIYKDMERILR